MIATFILVLNLNSLFFKNSCLTFCFSALLSFSLITHTITFLILHANEMYTEAEFCTKEICVYNKNVLSKISEILAVESNDFSKNRATIAKEEASLKKKYG